MVKLSIAFAGDKSISEYIQLAQQVEAFGFDTLSIYDDLLFKPAWPILFAIAPHTTRVRLGPAITNPYLTHPALLAGNVALLDEISGGRAYLGIGRGAFLDFIGVEQPRPITVVREAVQMVRRFLRGERTPFAGQVYQAAAGAFLRWQPLRSDLPIMIGTWGPRLCEVAGEIADEVKVSPMWSADYANQLWQSVQKGVQRAGRPANAVTLTIGALTSVAEDRDEARRYARRSLGIYLPYLSPMTENMGVDPEEIARVREASTRGDYESAAQSVSERSLENFALYGTPHDLIEKIEAMVASTPVTRIEFGTPHGPDKAAAIRLLGETVVAHFMQHS